VRLKDCAGSLVKLFIACWVNTEKRFFNSELHSRPLHFQEIVLDHKQLFSFSVCSNLYCWNSWISAITPTHILSRSLNSISDDRPSTLFLRSRRAIETIHSLFTRVNLILFSLVRNKKSTTYGFGSATFPITLGTNFCVCCFRTRNKLAKNVWTISQFEFWLINKMQNWKSTVKIFTPMQFSWIPLMQ